MPSIRTFWRLLAFLSGLVITLLGIAYIGQLGVVAVIAGEHIAYTYMYPIISVVLQVLSYVAVVAILYLMGWAVVGYIKNRHTPIEPSNEAKAIYKLTSKIDALVDEIRKDRGERTKHL